MGIVEGNYYMLDLFYSKPFTVLELGPYFVFSGAKSRSPNSHEIPLAVGKFGCPKHNLSFHLASCLQFIFFLLYFLFGFRLALSHEKSVLIPWVAGQYFWFLFLFSFIQLKTLGGASLLHIWFIHTFWFFSPAISQGKQGIWTSFWNWQAPGVDPTEGWVLVHPAPGAKGIQYITYQPKGRWAQLQQRNTFAISALSNSLLEKVNW